MKTRNGPAQITFHINSTSTYVWEHHSSTINYTYLTTERKFVDPDDITMAGVDTSDNNGWNSDNWPYNQSPFLGRGFYRITVEGKSATLKVDCYGTDFNYPGSDYKVVYYYDQDKFKDLNGTVISEVNLYDDIEGLQPTVPLNFRCTNSNQIGEHPHFAWDGTSWPNGIRGEREITVYYKIYRNGIGISPGITDLEWTDNSVTMDESGKIFRYHATAKLSHSPESEKSNIVYLTISLPKQKNNNQFREEERKNTSHEFDISDIFCYPNPFNPITNISYFLPDEGYVYLAIYNITGQRVAELVNERRHVGTYQVIFDGKSLTGGIYFVHLKFNNNQHLLRKIFLIK